MRRWHLVLCVLLAFGVTAQANYVVNGDFQTIVKPGTTIAATIPDGCYFGIPGQNIKGGGPATYGDGTTGDSVELPGWVAVDGTNSDCMQGGTWGGPLGSGDIAFLCFGTWGGPTTIETAAPLSVSPEMRAGTLELSADVFHTARPVALELLLDGVALTPDTVSSPDGAAFEWVKFTRTYSAIGAGDLTVYVGTSDGVGTGTWSGSGNRASVDNVTLSHGGEQLLTLPLAARPADLYEDNEIDFKDFAELAGWWLDEQPWP
jgi:hypothetical protein